MNKINENLLDFNFDEETYRNKSNACKWEGIDDEEVYPMWVADMEFKTPPAVLKRLRDRVEEGVMGYESLTDKYYEAVAHWLEKRHSYTVENEDIICCAEATVAISVFIQTFTEPGDEILINTPVYGGFFSCINGCGRVAVGSPLKNDNGKYSLDFEDMEKRITEKTKAMLICNPQNPTGNVWSIEELEDLCKFCKKHNLYIISDEVHYDFIFNGKVHTMTANVAEKMGMEAYTIVSPGKTFNVSGSRAASMIIKNKDMRERFKNYMSKMKYPSANDYVEPATIGSYMESEEWFDSVNDYIAENRRVFESFFEEKLPMITVSKGDSTYLMWIDCSKLGLSDEELEVLWRDKCKLILSTGAEFGEEYSQFRRVNIACQRAKLLNVLNRIEDVFKKEGYLK